MQNTVGRALCGLIIVALSLARPTEQERVKLWYEAGNHWPPTWQEETDGMKRLMEHREKEIMAIPGADERWENWMQYTQSRLVPKFTPKGFLVTKTPKAVAEKLKNVVDSCIARFDSLETEGDVNAIYSPEDLRPKFCNIGSLANEVMSDLQGVHEGWVNGMKLVPTSAYGVRLYQNGSSLVMHYDKMHTHVSSSIVHIAHEYDDPKEQWPIQIEDHDGALHSVNLKPGQMLFYESAKCLHGRMKTFRGKYYGSIFVHYKPVDKSIWNYDVEQVIAAVPPHWNEGILDESGSRWAGQAITTDSRVAEGAPPRFRDTTHGRKSGRVSDEEKRRLRGGK